jgi:hypothetical protein
MTHSADLPPPSSDERTSRCQKWSAVHAHQVAAGKARTAQMTREERSVYGHATFDAFSARFRAQQGLPPLSAVTALRYLTPEHIRRVGMPLAPPLSETIYRAWCAGQLLPVSAWLDDYPPADPTGVWAAIWPAPTRTSSADAFAPPCTPHHAVRPLYPDILPDLDCSPPCYSLLPCCDRSRTSSSAVLCVVQ